jgi:glycosyltransferase involved in cell wall biosynthesis
MSEYFSIDPSKIHVTPLGLDVNDFIGFLGERAPGNPDNIETIGYMARLAKEKGLHHLVDAFIKLKRQPGTEHIKLKIAGWLSPENEGYANEQWRKLDENQLTSEYDYLGSIDRSDKLEFFRSIDVLSVPTEFQEPKGLYALEALAAGVPLVLPAHGAFPELIEQTQGGVLFEPGNTDELSQKLIEILRDLRFRTELATQGQKFVHDQRNADTMARATSELIEKFVR